MAALIMGALFALALPFAANAAETAPEGDAPAPEHAPADDAAGGRSAAPSVRRPPDDGSRIDSNAAVPFPQDI